MHGSASREYTGAQLLVRWGRCGPGGGEQGQWAAHRDARAGLLHDLVLRQCDAVQRCARPVEAV
jgi:predicted DNA-binding WGR domain protein